jgi:benzil reductase ((S)-benzoin forming)
MTGNSMKHLTILTGASRGMGLAMAKQLISQGHELLCISRQQNPDLTALAQAHSVPITQWQKDLAEPMDWLNEFQNLLKSKCLLTINISPFTNMALINNAAMIPTISPFSEAIAREQILTLRVGLEAPMLLTGAFLSATKHFRGSRKVLNISSGLGRTPMASQSAYCATKAGMDHFSRCVALDEALASNGAKICSLAPGVIDTDMQVQLRSAANGQFPDVGYFEELKTTGGLASPQAAAEKVLAYLGRANFGANPVADVRDPI